MDIIDTFGFLAPAQVVYDNLVDPDRTGRWLPPGVRFEQRTEHHVRVVSGQTSMDVEVAVVPDDMRVNWRCLDPPHLHGTVRVGGSPIGGSHVHVVVTTSKGGPDPATVRHFLDRAMRHLQRDVSDIGRVVP